MTDSISRTSSTAVALGRRPNAERAISTDGVLSGQV